MKHNFRQLTRVLSQVRHIQRQKYCIPRPTTDVGMHVLEGTKAACHQNFPSEVVSWCCMVTLKEIQLAQHAVVALISWTELERKCGGGLQVLHPFAFHMLDTRHGLNNPAS